MIETDQRTVKRVPSIEALDTRGFTFGIGNVTGSDACCNRTENRVSTQVSLFRFATVDNKIRFVGILYVHATEVGRGVGRSCSIIVHPHTRGTSVRVVTYMAHGENAYVTVHARQVQSF